MNRMYYEAYDDRYRQVHKENLRWFAQSPSPVVMETIKEFGIQKTDKLLEIGCGEGRDAAFLMNEGFDLMATDISSAAIAFCRKKWPEYSEKFKVLDCLKDELATRYDFLYAVAVLHMLVRDIDRAGFYRFVATHLTDEGIALICSMGDGKSQHSSDISTAFDLQERIHEASGRVLHIAGTSYRSVCFEDFERELADGGLCILKKGITVVEPDYGNMMYAVVKRA